MNQATDFQMFDNVTMDDATFEFLGEDGDIVKLSSVFEIDLYKSLLHQNIKNECIDQTSLTLKSMNQILDTLIYVKSCN